MTDIARLFQEDPLKLTKTPESLGAIIAYYRSVRDKFNLGEKSAGSTKKMKAAPGPKLDKLDLDDLLS